jgi:hypothetical protein
MAKLPYLVCHPWPKELACHHLAGGFASWVFRKAWGVVDLLDDCRL